MGTVSTPPRHAWSPLLTVSSELLALPAALVMAAVLSRMLGPAQYGLIGIALAITSWTQWTVATAFGRAGVALVGGAGETWRDAADTLTALHLWCGIAALLLLVLVSPLAESFAGAPGLAVLLVLLAFDLPAFALASAHRSILAARGALHARAAGNTTRWIVRTALVTIAALSGIGLRGVAVAIVLTSLAELFVLRRFVQPSWSVSAAVPPRALLATSAAFFGFAALMRLFERVDLLLLKQAGVNAETIGWYTAAQNLAAAPAVLTLFVSSLLLGAIARDRAAGRVEHALSTARSGVTLLLYLLPVLAVLGGGSTVLMRVVFGAAFTPAVPFYAWLCAGAWGFSALWIGASVLSVYGRIRQSLVLAASMLLLSTGLILWLVPSGGAIVAAQITAAVAGLGGIAALVCCARVGVVASAATAMRCAIVAVVVLGGARWATEFMGGESVVSSWPALAALAFLGCSIPVALRLLREPNPVALLRLLSDSAR